MFAEKEKVIKLYNLIHNKYDVSRHCLYTCRVSASGFAVQIKTKRGEEAIGKQTVPWSHLEKIECEDLQLFCTELMSDMAKAIDSSM